MQVSRWTQYHLQVQKTCNLIYRREMLLLDLRDHVLLAGARALSRSLSLLLSLSLPPSLSRALSLTLTVSFSLPPSVRPFLLPSPLPPAPTLSLHSSTRTHARTHTHTHTHTHTGGESDDALTSKLADFFAFSHEAIQHASAVKACYPGAAGYDGCLLQVHMGIYVNMYCIDVHVCAGCEGCLLPVHRVRRLLVADECVYVHPYAYAYT